LIYRNYKKRPNIKELIFFRNFCKKEKRKFIIALYYDLVIKFNLDGFYIPSFDKNVNYKILNNKKNYLILGSAHNYKECIKKKLQGINQIFLAPIFKTNKNNNFLGLYKFKFLCNFIKINIIALGGINEKNYKYTMKLTNAGIASITSIFKINNNL